MATANSSEFDFLQMQRSFYNQFSTEHQFKHCVVGCWDVNQRIPYVEWLLHYGGDTTRPLFADPSQVVAIDYGCGIGRMVDKFAGVLQRVDGVDLGVKMIDYCKEHYPQSKFWVSDGETFRGAGESQYDLVYSTICLQHIPCHTIRMKILKDATRVLKPGGKLAVQMLYFDSEQGARRYYASIKATATFSRWDEDAYWAEDTNSCHDVAIFDTDLPKIQRDLQTMFRDVEVHIERWNPNASIHQIYLYGTNRKS
ncbi:MAG: class I SAM-dependent methyltransferase [Pirellulales bacterium]